jgi:hypothetical protein
MLLLDEPTAGLDDQASERILGPVRRLMAGRTTIVISHDLLTVAEADQILYLERGRVVEAGTHEQLLGADNGYAHLYRLRHPESTRVAVRRGPGTDSVGRHRAPGPASAGPTEPLRDASSSPLPFSSPAPAGSSGAGRLVPVPDRGGAEPWDGAARIPN